MPYADPKQYKAYQDGYRKANASAISTQKKAKYKKDPSVERNRLLKYWYGITLADYEEFLRKQNGACAICKNTYDYTLHVDHNHTTGEIRGLLCHNCNMAIGHLQDSSELARATALYIDTTRTGRTVPKLERFKSKG